MDTEFAEHVRQDCLVAGTQSLILPLKTENFTNKPIDPVI